MTQFLTVGFDAAEESLHTGYWDLISHSPTTGWFQPIGNGITLVPEVDPGLKSIQTLHLISPTKEANIFTQWTSCRDKAFYLVSYLIWKVMKDIKCNDASLAVCVQDNLTNIVTDSQTFERLKYETSYPFSFFIVTDVAADIIDKIIQRFPEPRR